VCAQARLVEAHNVLNILLRLGEEAVNQMVKRCAVGVLRQVALYYCFTAAILLYYFYTALLEVCGRRAAAGGALLLLYCCFTALLLYY
jgi:Ca2+/Na+ antiporter